MLLIFFWGGGVGGGGEGVVSLNVEVIHDKSTT
jgi:hypothetical protein